LILILPEKYLREYDTFDNLGDSKSRGPGAARNFVWDYSIEHGYNSRLDELHAEILLCKLANLDNYIARRRVLAQQYDQFLPVGLSLPKTMQGNKHVYYLYVCRHTRRDKIISELQARDILVNISYQWPIHTMTGYQFLGYKEGDLPHTETASREIFSLPMYPSLTDNEQQIVITALQEILNNL